MEREAAPDACLVILPGQKPPSLDGIFIVMPVYLMVTGGILIFFLLVHLFFVARIPFIPSPLPPLRLELLPELPVKAVQQCPSSNPVSLTQTVQVKA